MSFKDSAINGVSTLFGWAAGAAGGAGAAYGIYNAFCAVREQLNANGPTSLTNAFGATIAAGVAFLVLPPLAAKLGNKGVKALSNHFLSAAFSSAAAKKPAAAQPAQKLSGYTKNGP